MSGNNATCDLKWNTSKAYTLIIYSIHCVEAAIIILGNAFTIAAVVQTKKLNKLPTNVFITSLAISDGIIGVLLPILVGVKLLDTQQVWKGTACLFLGPYFSMFPISLLTLLGIAVDRYLAVANPLIYRQRMTPRRARIISGAIWIITFSLVTGSTCYFGAHNNTIELREAVRFIFPKVLLTVLLQMMILTPILGNIMIYSIIYVKLMSKKKVGTSGCNNVRRQNSSTKTTKVYVSMMSFVLAYLVIACVPYYVLVGIVTQVYSDTPSYFTYLVDASVILLYSNSFMNPVIYSWKNRNYREAYKNIITCDRPFTAAEDIGSISMRINSSIWVGTYYKWILTTRRINHCYSLTMYYFAR